tara:strand:- start:56 stop:298 length:243 start_codon:yes stop_codon:yes gene_type:complete
MWGVDVRAVRQEMAKLRSIGWLVKKRGYRGCVSRCGSDTSQILQDTQKNWESVGVVFVLRMEGRGHINPPRAKPVPRAIY